MLMYGISPAFRIAASVSTPIPSSFAACSGVSSGFISLLPSARPEAGVQRLHQKRQPVLHRLGVG
jgi:hypothetical protein